MGIFFKVANGSEADQKSTGNVLFLLYAHPLQLVDEAFVYAHDDSDVAANVRESLDDVGSFSKSRFAVDIAVNRCGYVASIVVVHSKCRSRIDDDRGGEGFRRARGLRDRRRLRIDAPENAEQAA